MARSVGPRDPAVLPKPRSSVCRVSKVSKVLPVAVEASVLLKLRWLWEDLVDSAVGVRGEKSSSPSSGVPQGPRVVVLPKTPVPEAVSPHVPVGERSCQ